MYSNNEEVTNGVLKEVKAALTGRTILLTGAGGAVIPLLIKLLKAEGCRVLAVDMDPNAVGLFLADKGYIIPAGLLADFVPTMRRICQQEKVDAIVPLVDEELLAAWDLANDGIEVILPRKEFVNICLDKWQLMQRLHEADIRVPETRLASNPHRGIDFPMVVKPRTGRGSRGLGLVRSELELEEFLAVSPYAPEENLLQEYIEGTEFTVSVLVWRDGKVQAVVPKEIVSKKGITRIAISRCNRDIDLVCHRVQQELQANGPFNVQLRLDSKGEPCIFEINPRFSTSISLTIATGINELLITLGQALLGLESRDYEWREGVVLLRQTADCFIDENEFLDIRNSIVRNNN